MIKMKSKSKGFTLLELMIVIIIIGVLASLAVPTYIRARQRAYKAEALVVLAGIRQSEYRYYLGNDIYTATLSQLDFDPAQDVTGTQHYGYAASGVSSSAFTITATRNSVDGGDGTSTVTINQDGTLGGTHP